MTSRAALAGIALVQGLGLLAVGWVFRHALNADAVAYLRLAEHYAAGDPALAVSGYWSPLLSWLFAPLLKAGLPPLVAARAGMGISAVVFFWGCVAFFRAARLPDKWLVAGAWTAALVSLPWSVANITPDLLLAGLVAGATSCLLQQGDGFQSWRAWLAGLIFGLAFLAKAVALPLALVVAVIWHDWIWRAGHCTRKAALGLLARFLLGLAVIALPWIATLSAHYGRFMFSTSARVAHAIAGPTDVVRYHPTMRTLHTPPPGRLTTWEEPSQMAYTDWSPLENPAYARHQAGLFLENLGLGQLLLTTVFLDWPCLLVFLLLLWRRPAWRAKPVPPMLAQAARFSLLLVGVLALAYLPGHLLLGDQRYFYPALPLLFVAGVWFVEKLPLALEGFASWLPGVLAASFAVPALVLLFWLLPPKREAGELAHRLAGRLQETKLGGPLAGSALRGGARTGLLAAYLARQPWHGDQPRATPEDYHRAGAQLVVANLGSALAQALAESGLFRDITPELFAGEEGREFPIRMYRVKVNDQGRNVPVPWKTQ